MARRSVTRSPARSTALHDYRRKRDLRASGEPDGVAPRRTGPLRFVIQKHDATRLHYDLRLEMEGVLKSWAVPKGLPTDPGARSLAIQVEDHPLEYGGFEGIIPPGNYGAGTVMLWDRGHYTTGDADPVRAWRKGRLHFALAGEKLLGEWTLVRLPPDAKSDKRNWLVIKNTDHAAPRKTTVPLDQSVLSGRSLEEIAGGSAKAKMRSPKASKRPSSAAPRKQVNAPAPARATKRERAPRAAGKPAQFVPPMKALGVEAIPAGDWRLELKFDGFRALAVMRDREVTLFSRNHNNLSPEFPEIVDALRRLRLEETVIDGELVALDPVGRSSFQLMQQRGMGEARPPIIFYAFDLLHAAGRSLVQDPIEARQEELARVLRRVRGPIKLSPVFTVPAEELLEEVRAQGLEGIVAKRAGSTYESGRRSGAWLKCRVAHEQEFVIGGYTEPQGARAHFGALLVGYFDDDKFLYAGKVGTGFDAKLLRTLHAEFQPLVVDDCPFANLPSTRRSRFGTGMTAPEMRRVTWLRPKLVCQVRFTEWTDDGSLRHPVFLGLRRDKSAREVRREAAAAAPAAGSARRASNRSQLKKKAPARGRGSKS